MAVTISTNTSAIQVLGLICLSVDINMAQTGPFTSGNMSRFSKEKQNEELHGVSLPKTPPRSKSTTSELGAALVCQIS